MPLATPVPAKPNVMRSNQLQRDTVWKTLSCSDDVDVAKSELVFQHELHPKPARSVSNPFPLEKDV